MQRQQSLSEVFDRLERDRIKKLSTKDENKYEKTKKQKNALTKHIDNSKKQEKVLLELSGSQSVKIIQKNKKQADNISEISAKTQKIPMHNVIFYTNKIKSVPKGEFIDIIHKKWWNNYDLLEQHHGFIQWLFPNAFKSRFNSQSYPLARQEEQEFRENKEVAERYIKSYIMMLQFYGMKLRSKETGEIVRSRNPNYQQRYQATLLTCFHNHMRITRILSSLVMVGFGRYAKKLSLFLQEEIKSENGGLRGLQKCKVYERQWKQFTQFVERDEDLNILLRNKKKS